MTELLTIILAAGEGTRMQSGLPKVLHQVAGRSIIGHVVSAARDAGTSEIAVVTSPDRPEVAAEVHRYAPGAKIYHQVEKLGTAHAARMAEPSFSRATGQVVVVYADHPLLRSRNFAQVLAKLDAGYDSAIMGFETPNPTGFGRLLVDGDRLLDIREEKDATEAERRITLCNACALSFRADVFRELIDQVDNDNSQHEYYLTDLVRLASDRGYRVAYTLEPEIEVLGVNSRAQLAQAEHLFQQRFRNEAMQAGVTLRDPQTTYFCHDTRLGRDVTIEPNVVFGPGVTIKDNVLVRAFSHIEGATIASGAIIGPFARLRPGADIASNAHIGNFVEIKNTNVGEGAKVNHLAYMGDADIGAGTNVGAGAITCNYDGVNKHRTRIGKNTFVGTNASLVAPVTIGEGAYIASGSVITGDVEADALALGRARQVNKPGYASKLRAMATALKQKNAKKSVS